MRPPEINTPITGRDGKQTTKGQAIVDAIALGVPKEMAAKAAGIDPTTFYRWQADGRDLCADPEDDRDFPPDHAALYRQFYQAVRKAEGDAVVFAVEVVQKAMPTHWQAAMTWLERRFPDDFARQERVRQEGEVTVTHKLEAAIDAESEDLERRLRLAPENGEAADAAPRQLAAGNQG